MWKEPDIVKIPWQWKCQEWVLAAYQWRPLRRMSAWSYSENMATEQKQTLVTDSTDIQLLLRRLEKQIEDFWVDTFHLKWKVTHKVLCLLYAGFNVNLEIVLMWTIKQSPPFLDCFYIFLSLSVIYLSSLSLYPSLIYQLCPFDLTHKC